MLRTASSRLGVAFWMLASAASCGTSLSSGDPEDGTAGAVGGPDDFVGSAGAGIAGELTDGRAGVGGDPGHGGDSTAHVLYSNGAKYVVLVTDGSPN